MAAASFSTRNTRWNAARVDQPLEKISTNSTGYRHYLYGGAPGVPKRLSDQLRERFPGIQISGTYSPPFRPLTPKEDAEAVHRINESRADIVWVGLSTPKQEYWMAAHLRRLDAPVMLGVGAAFDFLAGTRKRAPRCMTYQ